MLNVKYDGTRPYEQGRYWVELVQVNADPRENAPRFGYWCDKAHLRHMAHAIFDQFRWDVVEHLLDDHTLTVENNRLWERDYEWRRLVGPLLEFMACVHDQRPDGRFPDNFDPECPRCQTLAPLRALHSEPAFSDHHRDAPTPTVGPDHD